LKPLRQVADARIGTVWATSAKPGNFRSCFFLPLLISLSACVGTKNIQGKWEADIASKRSGPAAKVIFEFLPDGTFNAMPSRDTTVIDKDKYQLLDDGRTLKIHSQLLGADPVCKFTGDAIQCESETANTNFKRL